MPSITDVSLPAFVIHAGPVGGVPVFLASDGSIAIGTAGRTERLSGGALVAARTVDGAALLVGGDDGKVTRVAADGTTTVVAERGRKWIDQIAAGPGGAVAFASGRTAWVVEGSGKAHELARPSTVSGLAFFPKGLRLALSGYNGVGLWFPGTAAAAVELEWKGSHTGVVASPDGAYVVTTMQEMALHGWRLRDGQHMRMTGYPAKVKSVSWSPKGRFLATSGAGASIAWPFHYKDGPMGRRPLELGPRQELVTCVACHPAEEIAAIGYEDGLILLVRFSDGEEVLLRRPGKAPISALGWDGGGLELAFGSEAGEAGVIELAG